eukprot:364508-Chlamydomonas_euryale.AAC.15
MEKRARGRARGRAKGQEEGQMDGVEGEGRMRGRQGRRLRNEVGRDGHHRRRMCPWRCGVPDPAPGPSCLTFFFVSYGPSGMGMLSGSRMPCASK